MFKAGVRYYAQPRAQRNMNNGAAIGACLAKSSRGSYDDDESCFCYDLLVWMFWFFIILIIHGFIKKNLA
jgi:hypothetical protein